MAPKGDKGASKKRAREPDTSDEIAALFVYRLESSPLSTLKAKDFSSLLDVPDINSLAASLVTILTDHVFKGFESCIPSVAELGRTKGTATLSEDSVAAFHEALCLHHICPISDLTPALVVDHIVVSCLDVYISRLKPNVRGDLLKALKGKPLDVPDDTLSYNDTVTEGILDVIIPPDQKFATVRTTVFSNCAVTVSQTGAAADRDDGDTAMPPAGAHADGDDGEENEEGEESSSDSESSEEKAMSAMTSDELQAKTVTELRNYLMTITTERIPGKVRKEFLINKIMELKSKQ